MSAADLGTRVAIQEPETPHIEKARRRSPIGTYRPLTNRAHYACNPGPRIQ
jgi:hypothetical protein